MAMQTTRITILECACSKCNHMWRASTQTPPRMCPKCKSIKWNDDYTGEAQSVPGYKRVFVDPTTYTSNAPKNLTNAEARFVADINGQEDFHETEIVYDEEYLHSGDEYE